MGENDKKSCILRSRKNKNKKKEDIVGVPTQRRKYTYMRKKKHKKA